MPEQTIEVVGYGEIVVEADPEDNGEAVALKLKDNGDTEVVRWILWEEEGEALVQAITDAQAQTGPFAPPPEPTTTVVAEPVEPVYVPAYARRASVEAYIAAKVPAIVRYVAQNGEETTRVASFQSVQEPLFGSRSSGPYVVTWDHEQEQYRYLTVDRINGLAPAGEEYIDKN